MAVLHWVIQLNNAWGMVRESFIVPVITLASEKRVTISWLTRILSNLQAILLRPSQTKSLVDTFVYRSHKWLWFNMKRPALTLQIISICPQGHNVITKGPRLQSQIGETIPSRLWLTFRGRLSQQQKKRLRGTSIASKGYLPAQLCYLARAVPKKREKEDPPPHELTAKIVYDRNRKILWSTCFQPSLFSLTSTERMRVLYVLRYRESQSVSIRINECPYSFYMVGFFIDCRFFTRWPMSLMLWFSQERVRSFSP